MAKKTASELKAEGAELGTLLATARKRPLNFALLIAKEGIVLEAHPTKGADVMRRQAKANGGGSKGIQGVMNVSGKVIEFTSEGDDVPGPLAKATKRHLRERGLPFKVVILLPGGGRMDDGEEDGDDPAPEQPEAEPEDNSALKADLTARLRALVPQVKDYVARKHPEAEKLGRGLQAAGAELSKEALDKAEQLIQAVEKAIRDALTETPADMDDALRTRLKEEFAAISGGLENLKSRGLKPVAGKADQLAKMFSGLIDGKDLKKAGAVLSLIKTFVGTELGKLSDAASGLAEDLSSAVDKGLAFADDFVDSLTEDGRKKLELQALGYSEAEQDAIVAELATNPKAVQEAKEKVVDAAAVDPAQKAMLKKLVVSDPKAFAAAMAALKAMDAGGPLDMSPASMQASLDAFEAARKKMADAVAAKKAAETKIGTATLEIGVKAIALGVQRGLAAVAAKALADFQAGLPDAATMTEAERKAAVAESNRLINANEDAKKALAAAEKAQADAVAAREAGIAESAAADTAITAAKAPLAAAEASNDALDSKRAMLEALTSGRLSPGAKPAFKDEDKAAFLAAFARDGKLASSAMDIAAGAKDPSVVAQNVGFVAAKMTDGFADAKGNALDVPKEQLRAMSRNALQMGALQGQDYFKGLDGYLKSGAQLKPDPYGGLSEPIKDSERAETQRLNKIALGRTGALGAAALRPDGSVDFSSDAAKAAMDHMMFHPGSLTTFTPQMTQKMAETKAIFADATKGPKAQALVARTALPAAGADGALISRKIIGGTMGKAPADVTDQDAKASVLSAMMTPLSQGPVGSCFSTAPVRAIRETDPLRAMEEYSKIASTGLYQGSDGISYPANITPPAGENPLMRSWEYSVATAAAEQADSFEKRRLRRGVFNAANAAGNLLAIQAIVGPAAWNNTTDPVSGDIIPGVGDKLFAAVTTQLKFEYNAGPQVGSALGAAGGDGSSKDGKYKILHGTTVIEDQAAFETAIEAIALGAAGVPAGSPQEAQIIALVHAAPFIASVLSVFPNGKAPWNMPDGGMESQTAKILNGGTPSNATVLGAASALPAATRTARATQLLSTILTTHPTMTGDMAPLGTFGTDAAHAFNTLPNDPSLTKVKPPNSAAKIQAELIAPGAAIAAKVMTKEETQRLYDKQINAFLADATEVERPLLLAALKRGPGAGMTPADLEAKISTELAAYRAALAQRMLDIQIKDEEPKATPARKAELLAIFQQRAARKVSGEMAGLMASEFAMPEVVIADSNWGSPVDQTLFVMAADPCTGDLILWRKEKIGGKMVPLGQNWEDALWDTVK